MSTVEKALITAEEFMEMDLGDGTFELVRGEVVQLPPPRSTHGFVCANITRELSIYGRTSGHGFVFSNDTAVVTERGPDTVRGADVSFYSHARWPDFKLGDSLPPVAPDLVVEVLSPGDRPGKVRVKIVEYLEAGVPLVWLVDSQRKRVTVYRPDELYPVVLDEGETLEGFPELPGFQCHVADFFA